MILVKNQTRNPPLIERFNLAVLCCLVINVGVSNKDFFLDWLSAYKVFISEREKHKRFQQY